MNYLKVTENLLASHPLQHAKNPAILERNQLKSQTNGPKRRRGRGERGSPQPGPHPHAGEARPGPARGACSAPRHRGPVTAASPRPRPNRSGSPALPVPSLLTAHAQPGPAGPAAASPDTADPEAPHGAEAAPASPRPRVPAPPPGEAPPLSPASLLPQPRPSLSSLSPALPQSLSPAADQAPGQERLPRFIDSTVRRRGLRGRARDRDRTANGSDTAQPPTPGGDKSERKSAPKSLERLE